MSIDSLPTVNADATEVSAADIKEELDSGSSLTILDTRDRASHDAWSISHPNATVINIPFTEFLVDDETPVATLPDAVPDRPVVTCCAKGISSKFVADILEEHGLSVRSIADGMDGWARLYERSVVQATSAYTLLQYYRPSSGCLSYLLVSDGEAAVIDPLDAFINRYVSDAREHNATLTMAIDTHIHADHISGLRQLAADEDVTPVLPEGARERGLSFEATTIGADETVSVGGTPIEAVSLDGHTSEMLGYELDSYLISGDTVFNGGVARPDLEDKGAAQERAAALYQTIRMLLNEYQSSTLLPGHVSEYVYPETIVSVPVSSIESIVPSIQEEESVFVKRVTDALPPNPNAYQTIVRLNLGTARVDAETRFELELGPNNCGV